MLCIYFIILSVMCMICYLQDAAAESRAAGKAGSGLKTFCPAYYCLLLTIFFVHSYPIYHKRIRKFCFGEVFYFIGKFHTEDNVFINP